MASRKKIKKSGYVFEKKNSSTPASDNNVSTETKDTEVKEEKTSKENGIQKVLNSVKHTLETTDKKIIIAGVAVVVLIIACIVVFAIGKGKDKGSQNATSEITDTVDGEQATEETTLSQEELDAIKESEAQAERDRLIDAELDSYGELGICSLDDGGYLNIRAEASSGSEVIGKLYNHAACSIEGTSDEWLLISSGGFKGYVKADYIVTGDQARALAHDYISPRAIVDTVVLYVREEPDPEGKILAAVAEGERYEVMGQTDGWVQIDRGYISADYVTIKDCLNEARKLNDRSAVVSQYDNLGVSNVDSYLNVRKKPGEDADIIGKLPGNSGAEILGEEDGWYKIQSGQVTGYVKKEYMLSGKAAWDRAVQKAELLAVVNADVLNVRSGPGEEYEAWTQITNAERYPVIKQYDGWVELDLGDTDENGNATVAYASAAYVDIKYGLNEAVKFSPKEIAAAKASKIRRDVINYAVQFVGNPYVWGGTSLTNGCDCSGFVMKVMQKFGISLPHYSGAQSKMGTAVTTKTMQPGDLLFYASKGGTINHVAIYIGNGQIVHAANKRSGIKISKYNYRTPVAIRNVLGK